MLNDLALGTYGYSWDEQGQGGEDDVKMPPQIKLVIEKYDSSDIVPAEKMYYVSESTHEGMLSSITKGGESY